MSDIHCYHKVQTTQPFAPITDAHPIIHSLEYIIQITLYVWLIVHLVTGISLLSYKHGNEFVLPSLFYHSMLLQQPWMNIIWFQYVALFLCVN